MKNSKAKRAMAALLLLTHLIVPITPAVARYDDDPDPTEEGGGSGGGSAGWTLPADGFTWTAPERFHRWTSAWHERGKVAAWPTETYSTSYVNPPSWKLGVMGCQSENDYLYDLDPVDYELKQKAEPALYPDRTTLYQWEWDGQKSGFTHSCWRTLPFPKEGAYFVKLTVREPGMTDRTWDQPVQVRDFLVVVLGDSSASGEGAVDVPLWESEGRADWVDNRCHRSNYAGGAQAAKRLETQDSKTSVTFLSFACSGATLAKPIYENFALDPYNPPNADEYRGIGITGPYAGIEPIKKSNGDPDFSQKLPSQVDQLWNALTDFGTRPPRHIDVLINAGGINDARFADMAGMCVIAPFCYEARTGVLGTSEMTLDDRFRQNVATVPEGWDALGEALTDPHPLNNGTWATMSIDKKLALQYPPFFHDDEGDQCYYILQQSLPAWAWAIAAATFTPLFPPGWTVDEIEYADEDWAPLLDEKVRLGAERNGFAYVDTIKNRFHLHGICADNRYINDPDDSTESQGDSEGGLNGWWIFRTSSLSSKGTAHPNRKGYSAYADEIMRHISGLLKKYGNQPPHAALDKVVAHKNLTRVFNVLDNDSDPDVGDVLSARIVSQPTYGTATMQLDGTVKYTPGRGRGFTGTDTFVYEVTDGQDISVGGVTVSVIEPLVVKPIVIAGEVTEIEGLLGGYNLESPYRLVFDKPLRPDRGNARIDPDTGTLVVNTVPGKSRRIRLYYTIYSDTPSVTSPSYGESMRGTLVLRVRKAS